MARGRDKAGSACVLATKAARVVQTRKRHKVQNAARGHAAATSGYQFSRLSECWGFSVAFCETLSTPRAVKADAIPAVRERCARSASECKGACDRALDRLDGGHCFRVGLGCRYGFSFCGEIDERGLARGG